MKKYIKGFTLIELLVVIAIIGILASVVLVSLNSARNKGKDARIISSVQQMRVDAEAKYNGTDYSGSLIASNAAQTTGAGIVQTAGTPGALLTADVLSQGSVLYAVTNAGPTTYAIYGKLLSTGAVTYFCSDSTGGTKQSTANGTAATCQ